MGARFSWFMASPSKAEKRLTLDWLEDTGEPVRPGDCEYAGAPTPDGGFLYVAEGFWHKMIDPFGMELTSDWYDVVGCAQDSVTNTSVAFCYRNGRLAWQVSHILDKGREHLDIEGQPPATLKACFAQAWREARSEGHDAVFDVPAILAEEASGFRHGKPSTLRFTRHVRREQVSADEATRTLFARVESILSPWGFQSVESAGSSPGSSVRKFILSSSAHEISFDAKSEPRGDGTFFSLSWRLHNKLVHRLAGFLDTDTDQRTTASGSLALELDLRSCIEQRIDLETWLAAIDTRLPELLRAFHSLRALDALVNTGPRVSPLGGLSLSFFSLDAGHAPLVLAYLAGSERLDEMLREVESHPSADTRARVHNLMQHLRSSVKRAG